MNNTKKDNAGSLFRKIDKSIVQWKKAHGIKLLRLSIGFVFLWFGVLKFFPNVSPAEGLVLDTIHRMTFGLFTDSQITLGLALWEVLIGVGLISGKLMRMVLLLLFLQLPGTFLPIFFFPEQVFEWIPWVPTLKGQYIFKNLILIAAGIVMGSHVEPHPLGGLREKEG
ncbi:MAG: hypothetical protein JJU34_01075 [Lunatimonas sp.]|uniref:hypothetical protein n=1 Tax=Lunatimonas sp. TaxID=2060141 RepID=UPI00263B447C|nr:hypothetical protein [Lunatimonas sp.]MCC5935848.1 hypothetical protein [Lunatimonas sp.]